MARKKAENINIEVGNKPITVRQKVGRVTVTESLKIPETKVSMGPGIYTLVPVDSAGNETGEQFTVTEKMYKKAFSDTTKYKIKKKQN